MNWVTRLIILTGLTTLAGCSYFSSAQSTYQNQDKSYLAARSIPPIKVPPGLNSSAFHNDYPVSDRQYPPAAADVSLAPPGLVQN